VTDSRTTIVVMTMNRRHEVVETIARLPRPVIVVDNGSTDGTVAAVGSHWPDVTVVPLARNEGAVARNVGVALATTPYVAFADDDSWWDEPSLDRAADLLDAHPRLALVQGHVLVGPTRQSDPFCLQIEQSPLVGDPDVPGVAIAGFMSCASVVRRRAFVEVGGFDDVTQFRGEEERVALDLIDHGWELRYVPDVVAYHEPSENRLSSARQRRREARNDVLSAVMRRPWAVVVSRASRHCRRPAGAMGVAESAVRAPLALARRHRLSEPAEAIAALLD
jgi:GT2 family glycosyltransferase